MTQEFKHNYISVKIRNSIGLFPTFKTRTRRTEGFNSSRLSTGELILTLINVPRSYEMTTALWRGNISERVKLDAGRSSSSIFHRDRNEVNASVTFSSYHRRFYWLTLFLAIRQTREFYGHQGVPNRRFENFYSFLPWEKFSQSDRSFAFATEITINRQRWLHWNVRKTFIHCGNIEKKFSNGSQEVWNV